MTQTMLKTGECTFHPDSDQYQRWLATLPRCGAGATITQNPAGIWESHQPAELISTCAYLPGSQELHHWKVWAEFHGATRWNPSTNQWECWRVTTPPPEPPC